ncbi:MAG: energy transducer TonB [Halioglobus sp.]
MNTKSIRLLVATLLLAAIAPVLAAPNDYKEAVLQEVYTFASHNRMNRDALHRDVHADCIVAVTLNIAINADGSLQQVNIVETSTVPVFDRYSKYVVEQAAPFPPLSEYHSSTPDTINFDHVLRLDARVWNDMQHSTQRCKPL